MTDRNKRWAQAVDIFERWRVIYEKRPNAAAWERMEEWRKGFEAHLKMPERRH